MIVMITNLKMWSRQRRRRPALPINYIIITSPRTFNNLQTSTSSKWSDHRVRSCLRAVHPVRPNKIINISVDVNHATLPIKLVSIFPLCFLKDAITLSTYPSVLCPHHLGRQGYELLRVIDICCYLSCLAVFSVNNFHL